MISKDEYFGKQTDVIWEFDTNLHENDFYSSSNIENGILFTTTSEGEMYAFNSNSGQTIWEKSIGLKPTTPVVEDNMIFVDILKDYQLSTHEVPKNGKFQQEMLFQNL